MDRFLCVFLAFLAIVISRPIVMAQRRDINSLSPQQLQAFRDAVAASYQDGTWVRVAGDHGDPGNFCPHGDARFLPWHRRYMARLEDAIGHSLPYWDWAAGGIPAAFSEPTYTNARGEQVPNPLLSGPTNTGSNTSRSPSAWPTNQLRDAEERSMARTNFAEFSDDIEGAHNTVHGSVGGNMGVVSGSSYDPIFWIHHMNVDRVWYRWQLRQADQNRQVDHPSLATGELQDGAGTFSGQSMIDDLSRWGDSLPPTNSTPAPTTPQPNATSSSPPPGTPVPTPGTPAPTPGTPAPTPGGTPAPTPGGTPAPTPGGTPAPTPGAPAPTPGTPSPTSGAPDPTPIAGARRLRRLGIPKFSFPSPPSLSGRGSTWFRMLEANDGPASTSDGGAPNGIFTDMASSAAASVPVSAPSLTRRRRGLMYGGGIYGPSPSKRLKAKNDPTATLAETNPSPEDDHLLFILKDVESTSSPFKIEIVAKEMLIGQIFLFGMGKMNTCYKKDRLVDVSRAYDKLLDPTCTDEKELIKLIKLYCYKLDTKVQVVCPQFRMSMQWINY